MLKQETAYQRCFDRCNLIGYDVDIYEEMMRYKVFREMTEAERDEVYDKLSEQLFGKGC